MISWLEKKFWSCELESKEGGKKVTYDEVIPLVLYLNSSRSMVRGVTKHRRGSCSCRKERNLKFSPSHCFSCFLALSTTFRGEHRKAVARVSTSYSSHGSFHFCLAMGRPTLAVLQSHHSNLGSTSTERRLEVLRHDLFGRR